MNTSETMIQDYDEVLDARYGKEGTPERIKFEEEAYAYYTGLILRDARKDAKVSQAPSAVQFRATLKIWLPKRCSWAKSKQVTA